MAVPQVRARLQVMRAVKEEEAHRNPSHSIQAHLDAWVERHATAQQGKDSQCARQQLTQTPTLHASGVFRKVAVVDAPAPRAPDVRRTWNRHPASRLLRSVAGRAHRQSMVEGSVLVRWALDVRRTWSRAFASRQLHATGGRCRHQVHTVEVVVVDARKQPTKLPATIWLGATGLLRRWISRTGR